MKPTILTIDTTLSSPNLPIHYAPTSTTSRSRKTPLLTLLTLATISTLTILYLNPPSTTLLSHISASRTAPKTFIPNPAYNDLSPSADGNWTNLLPPNGGFFSSKVGDGYEMVGLTMFHQLHCLSMIRGALQGQKMEASEGRVLAGTDRRRSEDVGEDLFGVRRKREVKSEEDLFGVRRKRDIKRGGSEDDLFGIRRKRGEGNEGKPEHYLHCFDYLVQTILCNADATLEPAHETEDGRRAVDGYDVQHQCKSADAVWARVMGANSVPGWKLNAEEEREPEFDMTERRYS